MDGSHRNAAAAPLVKQKVRDNAGREEGHEERYRGQESRLLPDPPDVDPVGITDPVAAGSGGHGP